MVIKICGITNKADAVSAASLGVDMLGFVFYNGSKRNVGPAAVRDIINELPPYIAKVGVFVDEKAETVRSIAEDAGLDVLQFHGGESPEFCAQFKEDYKVIKAFRLKTKHDLAPINGYDVDYYLFDTYKPDAIGGTGEVLNWKLLEDFELLRPAILSGGLNPSNVAAAIEEVLPYGVDVSSGVEIRPGKKDDGAMKRFVEEVRKTR